MFRPGTRVPTFEANFCLNWGGLGDHIARIPALNYVFTNHKHLKPHLWVPDFYMPLAQHWLGHHSHLDIQPMSTIPYAMNASLPGLDAKPLGFSSMRMHLVDHGFSVYADTQPTVEQRNYPIFRAEEIAYPLPTERPYIVLTCGFTSPVRQWRPKSVNGVAEWCLSNGYEVVWLGSKEASTGTGNNIKGSFDNNIDFSRGIDLVGQTSLLQAGKVISGASAVVGVDNGLLHLAGCTDVPIVAAYTTVKPEHRLPIRHNELGWKCAAVVPEVACRFCQSNMHFIAGHSFTKCFYGDTVCTKEITADVMINALKAVLPV